MHLSAGRICNMANWAYVENNSVVEVHDVLPENWKNISNLSASENDLALLKGFGWYPVNTVMPTIDQATQAYGDASFAFDPSTNTVTQTYAVTTISQMSDSDLFAQQRASFMQNLRNQRDVLLSKSDWTQTVDLVQAKGGVWTQAWAAYRQELRNLPETYNISPLDVVVDYSQINWPAIPTGV